jgi:carbohydrate-binding DOMON domain-containing protein
MQCKNREPLQYSDLQLYTITHLFLARSKLSTLSRTKTKTEKEIAMKTTMRALATAAVATMVTAAPAFAAPNYSDNSGLLVWSFLGFAAVVVVAQVIPAMMMMVGMVKGAVAPVEAKAHN